VRARKIFLSAGGVLTVLAFLACGSWDSYVNDKSVYRTVWRMLDVLLPCQWPEILMLNTIHIKFNDVAFFNLKFNSKKHHFEGLVQNYCNLLYRVYCKSFHLTSRTCEDCSESASSPSSVVGWELSTSLSVSPAVDAGGRRMLFYSIIIQTNKQLFSIRLFLPTWQRIIKMFMCHKSETEYSWSYK